MLGAAARVLAGLFGVGGGIIIVPVLVFSFAAQGVDPHVLTHLAVGTSLATIVFTSINSVLEHQRKGAVLWPIVIWMTLGILLGAGLGSLTAAAIQGPVLQKIIGVFAILVAIQMGLELKPKAGQSVPGKLGLTAAGGVIGWASAIFGIGGGTLNMPFLTWRSVPMQQAVATSAACGLPIAAASALSFIVIGWSEPQLPQWSVGFVYLPAMAGIAVTSMFFARFGALGAQTVAAPAQAPVRCAVALRGCELSYLNDPLTIALGNPTTAWRFERQTGVAADGARV